MHLEIKRPLVFVFLLLIGFIFFAKTGNLLDESRISRKYEPYVRNDDEVLLQGQIVRKDKKENSYSMILKQVKIFQSGKTVHLPNLILITDNDSIPVGTITEIKGTAKYFTGQRNEGNFDEEAYYHRQGYGFRVFVTQMILLEKAKGHWWKIKENLYQLGRAAGEVFEENLPKDEAGILKTMVLGDRSTMSADVKRDFQVCGISHILAISGLHLSVLGMALYHCLRKSGASFGFSSGFSAGLILLYSLLIPGGAGTNRAVIMFGVCLIGQLLGRTYDSLSSLSLAGICLLAGQPFLLFDGGFLFSFAAVAGTILMNAYIKKHFERVHPLIKTLMISLGIQSVTLPLSAYYYYEIPLWAIPVNLIVIPLVGVVLVSGILGGLLGCCLPFLAPAALFPGHMILKGIIKLTSAVGGVKAAYICGKPMWGVMLIYYILLGILLAVLFRTGKNRWLGVLPLLLFLIVIRTDEGFSVTMLDVGQGDGIYIASREGTHYFIDGGSTDVKGVGEYRILPFLKSQGIGSIDYWFLSHLDEDHTSGFYEVISSGYIIRHLAVSAAIVKDKEYEKLTAAARQNGIPILYLKPGDVLRTKTLEIKCRNLGRSIGEDRNANSLILQLKLDKNKFSGIFAGDIPESVERELVKEGKLEKIDFYKADHHGSDESSCEDFLDIIQPGITGISCGNKNRYGHPGKACLERLKDADSQIANTRQGGQLKITLSRGRIKIHHFIKRNRGK